MRASSRPTSRAFTLVELLVVIAIIAVLTAMVTVVATQVIRSAHEAAIAIEMSNLEQAIETYKSQNKGSYPPDFTNRLNLEKHLRRAYPKANVTLEVTNFLLDPNQDGNTSDEITDFNQLDASEALVFFLGGGLYDNAEYPLTGGADLLATPPVPAAGKRRIFFEFDARRLTSKPDTDDDNFPSYWPQHGKQTPYVYFDSRNYDHDKCVYPKETLVFDHMVEGWREDDPSVVRPYMSVFPDLEKNLSALPNVEDWNKWANADTFQLISAGLDAHYGSNERDETSVPTPPKAAFKVYPHKIFPNDIDLDLRNKPLRKKDRDNIANFSEGKPFEDHLE